jgi:hypothetical protein
MQQRHVPDTDGEATVISAYAIVPALGPFDSSILSFDQSEDWRFKGLTMLECSGIGLSVELG